MYLINVFPNIDTMKRELLYAPNVEETDALESIPSMQCPLPIDVMLKAEDFKRDAFPESTGVGTHKTSVFLAH